MIKTILQIIIACGLCATAIWIFYSRIIYKV
jgi:hypothetical protein